MEDGGSRIAGFLEALGGTGALEVGRWDVQTFFRLGSRGGRVLRSAPDGVGAMWDRPLGVGLVLLWPMRLATAQTGRVLRVVRTDGRQERVIPWRRGALRRGEFSFHWSPLALQALRFNTGRQPADRHEILLWDARQMWPITWPTDRPGSFADGGRRGRVEAGAPETAILCLSCSNGQ